MSISRLDIIDVDNPAGGDCAYYAFAIGLMIALQNNSKSEAAQRIWRRILSHMNLLGDTEDQVQARLRFLDEINGFDIYQWEKKKTFLEMWNTLLRNMLYQYNLVLLKENPKNSPLYNDLLGIIDAAYEARPVGYASNYDFIHNEQLQKEVRDFVANLKTQNMEEFIATIDVNESKINLRNAKLNIEAHDLERLLKEITNGKNIANLDQKIKNYELNYKVYKKIEEKFTQLIKERDDSIKDYEKVTSEYEEMTLQFAEKINTISEDEKKAVIDLLKKKNQAFRKQFSAKRNVFKLIAETKKLVSDAKDEADHFAKITQARERIHARLYFLRLIKGKFIAKDIAKHFCNEPLEQSIIGRLLEKKTQAGLWGHEGDLLSLVNFFNQDGNNLAIHIHQNGVPYPGIPSAPMIIQMNNHSNIHWTTLIDLKKENKPVIRYDIEPYTKFIAFRKAAHLTVEEVEAVLSLYALKGKTIRRFCHFHNRNHIPLADLIIEACKKKEGNGNEKITRVMDLITQQNYTNFKEDGGFVSSIKYLMDRYDGSANAFFEKQNLIKSDYNQQRHPK